jgi:hypothetical protein
MRRICIFILLLFIFLPHNSVAALQCGNTCGVYNPIDKTYGDSNCSACCTNKNPCTSLCSQNKCKWTVNNSCTSWVNNGVCVNYCQNQVCNDGVNTNDMQIISCGGGTCGKASGSCGCGVNLKGNCKPCNTCDGGDIIVNGKSRC